MWHLSPIDMPFMERRCRKKIVKTPHLYETEMIPFMYILDIQQLAMIAKNGRISDEVEVDGK